MLDPSLEAYVRDARAAGHTEAQIRFDLKAVGWSDKAVAEALGVGAMPTLTGEPISRIWSSARRGLVLKILAGVCVVAVIGLGSYFSWRYYDTRPARALADMPKKMAAVKSASYKFQFKIRVTPESQHTAYRETKPPFLSPASIMQAVGNTIARSGTRDLAQGYGTDILQPVPPELKDAELDFRASGAYSVASSTNPAFSALLDFNFKAQGRNFAVSAEVRLVDKTVYARIISIPEEILAEIPAEEFAPFGGDIRKFLGEWRSFKLASLEQYGFTSGGSESSRALQEQNNKQGRLKKLAAESDLYAIKSSTRNETVAGAAVYHFFVELIKDNVVSFLREAQSILEDRNLTKEEERSILDLLEKVKGASMQLWIGKDDHLLRRSSLVISNFPYGSYNFPTELSFELGDFDVAQVVTPTGAAPFEDLIEESLGAARKRARDAKRLGEVRQIQLALELFADSHNLRYPYADIYSTAPCGSGTRCGLASPDACGSRNCMSVVPTDPSDDSRYLYSPMYLQASGRSFIAGYHIGATLEEQSNTALRVDRDCDSRSGACGSFQTIDRSKGFNGFDSAGCRGETNRACYDVAN